MDVTLLVYKHSQLIDSYGDEALKISSSVYTASVIVFPEYCFSPETLEADESVFKILREVFQTNFSPSIFLIGARKNTRLIPKIEKEFVRQRNCILDVMNTGAVCYTYNDLCGEDRMDAAVLFPVD